MTGTYDQWLILEIWTPFMKAPIGRNVCQRRYLTSVSNTCKAQGRI